MLESWDRSGAVRAAAGHGGQAVHTSKGVPMRQYDQYEQNHLPRPLGYTILAVMAGSTALLLLALIAYAL